MEVAVDAGGAVTGGYVTAMGALVIEEFATQDQISSPSIPDIRVTHSVDWPSDAG
jgi:hypothetical protein